MRKTQAKKRVKTQVRNMDMQRMQGKVRRTIDKTIKIIAIITVTEMTIEAIAFITSPLWYWMVT